MDFTIVENDCDVSWKEFLVDKKIAPKSSLKLAQKFYQQYLNQCLNINEFIQFQLSEFTQYNQEQMRQLCQEHFDTVIKRKIYPQAKKIIQQQIKQDKLVCLITATNNYIAQPLANYLGIKYLKATKLEEKRKSFSGHFIPPYCYGLNKTLYMKELIQDLNLENGTATTYYGDSINDISIFKWVTKAFVINAKGKLSQEAIVNNWKQLEFKLN